MTTIFVVFLGLSKIATFPQYFKYKAAFFGPKEDSVGHKKFQRLKKWGQMLSLMLSSGISGTTCPGVRVARSPKTPVRFC